MRHGSEAEGKFFGFLRKDVGAQSPEGRFDVAPMNPDAQALDANVEKLQQTVSFDAPTLTQFSGLPQIGDKTPDTRQKASVIGQVSTFTFTLMAIAACVFAAIAEFGKLPEFYVIAMVAALAAAVLGIIATFSNPPRV
jgi:hypothetical protein